MSDLTVNPRLIYPFKLGIELPTAPTPTRDPTPSNDTPPSSPGTSATYGEEHGGFQVGSEGEIDLELLDDRSVKGKGTTSPAPPLTQDIESWTSCTTSLLREYASRSVRVPTGDYINIELNHPSQMVSGALKVLANRSFNTPEPGSRLAPTHGGEPQLGVSEDASSTGGVAPEEEKQGYALQEEGGGLLENYVDLRAWSREYLRRAGQNKPGDNVDILLVILMNNFYEVQSRLMDIILSYALDSMHARSGAALEVQDFAFKFDFHMSQDIPFFVDTHQRVYNTLEAHRPRTSVPLPPTTRSGRVSRQTRAAMEEAERKREQLVLQESRKQQNATRRWGCATHGTRGITRGTRGAPKGARGGRHGTMDAPQPTVDLTKVETNSASGGVDGEASPVNEGTESDKESGDGKKPKITATRGGRRGRGRPRTGGRRGAALVTVGTTPIAENSESANVKVGEHDQAHPIHEGTVPALENPANRLGGQVFGSIPSKTSQFPPPVKLSSMLDQCSHPPVTEHAITPETNMASRLQIRIPPLVQSTGRQAPATDPRGVSIVGKNRHDAIDGEAGASTPKLPVRRNGVKRRRNNE